jgi:hypothetical protein
VTKTLAHLANLAVAWLLGAWMFMLMVGVVHAEWLPQLPTIGFGLALLLSALVTVRALFAALVAEVGKAINGDHR